MDGRSFSHGIDVKLESSKEFSLWAGEVFVKIFHGVGKLLFIFGMLILVESQLFFVFKGSLGFFVNFRGMGEGGTGEIGGSFEEFGSFNI